MNARLKAFLAGTAGLTLIVAGLPNKGEPNQSLQSVAPAVPVVAAEESAPALTLATPATSEQRGAQAARLLELGWGRDPFLVPQLPAVPVVEPTPEAEVAPKPEPALPPFPVIAPLLEEPAPEPPRLGGIMRRGESWRALLGPHVVSVGAVLPTGHKVTAISAEAVTLVLEGETLTLTLGASR